MMIYVEPTKPGRPVTALLMRTGDVKDEGGLIMLEVDTIRVSYSNDSGAWLWEDGTIVDPELGQAITEHAQNLGCTLS